MNPVRALLLTDVVDSTRLTEELGDARMAALWTAHDRIARDLLPLWRGREIDKTDGMLLLFEAVTDAVGYALAYHRALSAAQLPIRARAGIHVGAVSLRPNPREDVVRGAKPVEVDGLALPVAARVMSVAMGAQTLLSADARLALGVTTQRIVSHGHWRMHGVGDPVELFEIGDADAPFAAPPDGAKVYRVVRQGDLWRPVREVRHSVPAERDSFVGRQEPLRLLAKRFEEGARLISVLGIGGTGKTRLVTRYAWTRIGDYPGGVWFCDLSQARTLDGIFFAVAQGLDVPLGHADPVVQLAHAIAGRGECLVILDNFEQVARHAEATLGHWLERAPQARFIVTTREVLGIVGEQTFALDPLPADDATALFMHRAQAANGGFRASADDDSAISQLVEVLDGLPLAIELAAVRVRVLAPRALLARMNERFKLLGTAGGRRTRQATLRAAFDWSWDLLAPNERSALAQLSVFDAGFTLDAAEAIVDLAAFTDAAWIVDVVQSLVHKSLVRQLADDRFDLLETVREYAAEQLMAPDRFTDSGPAFRATAEQRHGAYFAAIRAPHTSDWRHVELDNLVTACRRAVARGDGAVAVHALMNAWGRLQLCGPFRIGVELSAHVGAIAQLADADAAELALVAGSALDLCGQGDEAERHLNAALQRGHRLGDTDLQARALNGLGCIQSQQGRVDEAVAAFEQALALARESRDRLIECRVLNQFGSFQEVLGRTEEARTSYEEALRLACAAKDRRLEGGVAGNLGQFCANQGRLDEARALYARAVAIAAEIGDRQWEANTRCNLGLLHHSEGRLNDARTELEAALSTARDMGHARLVSVVQCNLGLVDEALAQPDAALQRFGDAVGIARDLRDKRSEGQFLNCLGLLHARQGRTTDARLCLAQGAEALFAVGDRVSLGILMCGRAEAEHLAGDATAASAALAQAEALATDLSGIQPESEFGQALQRIRLLRIPVDSARSDRAGNLA